jgi:hypothetical protein
MRRRLPAILLALAAVALLPATPVGAHEQDPHVLTFLDQVIPAPPGVDIQVRQSLVPELVVENRTPTPLEVLTATGRPFLRIGPDGTFADFDTTDWYTTNSPIGVADIPPEAQAPDAAPRWVRVTSTPSWGWFDHRMHPVVIPDAPPEDSGVREISRWIVPLRYGTQDVKVLGHLSYVSLRGRIVTELTSPRTPFPGVTVDVLQGGLPGLLLTNASSQAVTVDGREGEPFARVGPAGVQVNLHSASWIDQLRFHNQPPAEAEDATAPPDWRTTDTATRFAWLETRAKYPHLVPPPAVESSSRATVLLTWRIPLTWGGRRVSMTGRTRFVPLAQLDPGCTLLAGGGACAGDGSFPTGPLLTAGLALLGVAILAATWLGLPRGLPWRAARRSGRSATQT